MAAPDARAKNYYKIWRVWTHRKTCMMSRWRTNIQKLTKISHASTISMQIEYLTSKRCQNLSYSFRYEWWCRGNHCRCKRSWRGVLQLSYRRPTPPWYLASCPMIREIGPRYLRVCHIREQDVSVYRTLYKMYRHIEHYNSKIQMCRPSIRYN